MIDEDNHNLLCSCSLSTESLSSLVCTTLQCCVDFHYLCLHVCKCGFCWGVGGHHSRANCPHGETKTSSNKADWEVIFRGPGEGLWVRCNLWLKINICFYRAHLKEGQRNFQTLSIIVEFQVQSNFRLPASHAHTHTPQRRHSRRVFVPKAGWDLTYTAALVVIWLHLFFTSQERPHQCPNT